jgi:hypothetical protein
MPRRPPGVPFDKIGSKGGFRLMSDGEEWP